MLEQRDGGQVEQPRGHYAAAPPDLGDVGQVQVVLVVFRIAHGRGFGVGVAAAFACVGVLQDVQPFGVCGHQAVFDAVVHHLDEVTGAGLAAIQIAFFGGAAGLLSPRRTIGVAAAGRQRLEDRIEMPDDFRLAADHLAEAALQSPDAAAGADIHVVQAFGVQFLGAANVVDVIGIAAVDDHVAAFHVGGKLRQRAIDSSGGNHQPDRAWRLERLQQIVERGRPCGAFARQLLYVRVILIPDCALVPAAHQTADHVRAHASQTDHPKLHARPPIKMWPAKSRRRARLPALLVVALPLLAAGGRLWR